MPFYPLNWTGIPLLFLGNYIRKRDNIKTSYLDVYVSVDYAPHYLFNSSEGVYRELAVSSVLRGQRISSLNLTLKSLLAEYPDGAMEFLSQHLKRVSDCLTSLHP